MTLKSMNAPHSPGTIQWTSYFQVSTMQPAVATNFFISNATTSNTMSMTWPPQSGRAQSVVGVLSGSSEALSVENGEVKLPTRALRLRLPDGSVIHLDEHGNYRIEDGAATVVYQANRMREFNPYVNASDMLARFIAYVGTLGLRQREPLRLPLELFVNWLIIEAATKDNDAVPKDVRVSDHPLLEDRRRPRCLFCRRFITRQSAACGFTFCDGIHAERFARRAGLDKRHAKLLAAA